MRISKHLAPSHPPTLAHRVFLSLLFVAFALVAGVLDYLTWTEGTTTLGVRFAWKRVPATIIESEVQRIEGKDAPYEVTALYRYDFQGQHFTSHQIFLATRFAPSHRYSNYADAQAVADRFPPGSTRPVRVAPHHPAASVLISPSLAPLLFLIPFDFLFTLLVFLLAAVALSAWLTLGRALPKPPLTAQVERPRVQRVAERWVGIAGAAAVSLVAGAVTALFAILLYQQGFVPFRQLQQLESWKRLPCKIISSRWISDEGGRPDILYSYDFGGRKYRSNRFALDFRDHGAAAEIVSRFQDGQSAECFINPAAPGEAVLSKQTPSLATSVWLSLFAGALAAFLVWAWTVRRVLLVAFSRRRPAPLAPSGGPPAKILNFPGRRAQDPSGPPVDVAVMRRAALFILIIFSSFLTAFTFFWMKGLTTHHVRWFSSVFLVGSLPLIGLCLVFYRKTYLSYRQLKNPVPRIVFRNVSVPLGGNLEFDWEIVGNLQRLQSLRITLEGKEMATRGNGSAEATDEVIFKCLTVVEALEGAREKWNGHVQVPIPAETMHTFRAPHNQVEWSLWVRGETIDKPPLEEAFNVLILPKEKPVLKITLRDGKNRFRPGENLEGEVQWELAPAPEWVELRLFWHTHGQGNTDMEIVDWQRWEKPTARFSEKFSLPLPGEPYSFSGQLITLTWALELVSSTEQFHREEFFMGPHGEEVLLVPSETASASPG